MLANLPILSMIALSPLLGVLVLLFVPKHKGQWIKVIGIVTTLIPLILAALLYAAYSQQAGGLQFAEQYSWINIPLNKETLGDVQSLTLRFDYNLAVDGLSLPMVFLTALVSTMAALASVIIKKRWKTYYILFLILETGMLGVFMAQDLFLFFLFFEITLVPTFFLIGIWGFMDREKAANKFLIYNGLGSAIMLIAFLILVTTAGFTATQDASGTWLYFSGSLKEITANLFTNAGAYVNMEDPNLTFFLSPAGKTALFLMIVIAFGIKLPIFPFHTWMLKVHAEAPTPIVMIHSGILLKMGAYGLIRFGVLLFPGQAKSWAAILAVLGLINILYGAVLAFVQKDFKLVLAYSSISHMGIVLIGIAAFNQIGLQGAVFQMVSHGLISALMFLLVGSIYERTATTRLDQLGGLAASIPFMSGILLIAGLASLGLPGLSGFVGEFLAFLGLFGSMKIITAISALGIILAAVYVLRGVLKITYGPLRTAAGGADAVLAASSSPAAGTEPAPTLAAAGVSGGASAMRDARLIEAVPMVILVAFIVLLGVYPNLLSQPLEQTVNGFNDFIQNFSAKAGG